MKYIIGIIVTSVILFIATYFILGIWGIDIMSSENIKKTLITLVIILGVSFFLLIILSFFFKNETREYDNNKGNIAQPKK